MAVFRGRAASIYAFFCRRYSPLSCNSLNLRTVISVPALHPSNLPFHPTVAFWGSFLYPTLPQGEKRATSNKGWPLPHCWFVVGQVGSVQTQKLPNMCGHLCMTMLRCVTAGVGVNTLSTGDLCSNGTKPRKGESVVWGWPLVWEHILPPLETTNKGELSFPSASNGVRIGEKMARLCNPCLVGSVLGNQMSW